MFDIGFSEIFFILIIGLIVIGPDKLPEVIRQVLKLIQQLRGMTMGVKADLEKELHLSQLSAELKNTLQGVKQDASELLEGSDIRKIADDLTTLQSEAQDHIHEMEQDLKTGLNDLGSEYFDVLSDRVWSKNEEDSAEWVEDGDYFEPMSRSPSVKDPWLKLLQDRQVELALTDQPLAQLVRSMQIKQAKADLLAEHEWMQFYSERLCELNDLENDGHA